MTAFDFTHRCALGEAMDEPGLAVADHCAALDGLRRINAWSGAAALLWRPILELAHARQRRRLRILDVATGGGDIPLELYRRGRAAGLSLTIEACDRSATALTHARQRAQYHNARIHYFEHDALQPLPYADYDIVISSLFMHHLSDAEAVAFLQRLNAMAGSLVLVNDLRRTRAGYALAVVGTRALSRSRIVHADGPVSVRRAFTCREVRDLATRAQLPPVTLTKHWPFRFLMRWNPQRGAA